MAAKGLSLFEPEQIPVISLSKPWANWVALGWKPIETRTHDRFRRLLGKRIGIHASATWDKDWLILAGMYLTAEQIMATERFTRIGGAIICTALVEKYRDLTWEDSPRALIDCAQVQRKGLFLEDVQVLKEAIPAKGRLGIWYEPTFFEAPSNPLPGTAEDESQTV